MSSAVMNTNQLEAEICSARAGESAIITDLRHLEGRTDILECLLMVGRTAFEAKDWIASRRAYSLVIRLDPSNDEALNRLGRVALVGGELDLAIDYFSDAFVRTQQPATAVNLAIAYGRQKGFTQALQYCAEAIILDRNFLPAYIHQAAIYEELAQPADAELITKRALELFPGNLELLHALGVYQLQRGDFENGWRNHEHRKPRLEIAAKLDEYQEWNGEPLTGKTILVVGEQGIGDQIQFARYLPLLVELGAKVVFRTRHELARLFGSLPQVQIASSDAELKDIEPDYWVALCSLPLRCTERDGGRVNGKARSTGGILDGFNSRGPYLAPLAADVARFAALIPQDGRLRVGLCWAGNAQHRRDEYRSMRFGQLGPILNVEGCAFYSLQAGPTASQNDGRAKGIVKYCHDLADTAAAIANLDLVISVDTAVLHLAGAMGRPAWGLIAKPSDWRWGLQGDQTPWYPSVKLTRQTERGNWAPVLESISKALQRDSAGVAVGLIPTPATTFEGLDQIDAERDSDYTGLVQTTGRLVATGYAKTADPKGESGHIAPQVITKPCRYGQMSFYQNDTYIGRALDLYQEYSESEVELFRRILKPGDVVVEAGANIGALTVPLAQIVGVDGAVWAFEPQPKYFRLLDGNVIASCAGVNISPSALGSERGTISVRDIPLDVIHAPGWKGKGEEIAVHQTTVDDRSLERLDLLKIDVDGQELEILQGAESTIARCRPLIYVENDKPTEYPDLLPWLHARGYRLHQHFAPLFNPDNFAGNKVNVFGHIVSAMVLAVPMERKNLRLDGLQRLSVENT